MQVNVGKSLLATGLSALLMWVLAFFATNIVRAGRGAFDSDSFIGGFIMLLIGAFLAFCVGAVACIVPLVAVADASAPFVLCGLCIFIVFHFLVILHGISFVSQTTLAYCSACAGSVVGGISAGLFR